jgi:hypothetical protein
MYAEVYVMFMDNGQVTTENVYFDDASLSPVPEPSSLVLAGIGVVVAFRSLLKWRVTALPPDSIGPAR